MWFCYLKTFAGIVLAILALAGLMGCATLNPQPPVEHFANKLADEAVIPAIKEGLAQGVEQLTIQAGAQGINPTYVVRFDGKWVVGIEGRASVGVEGIAGQLQVSSVSSEKTATSPHQHDAPPAGEAATEPATTVKGAP